MKNRASVLKKLQTARMYKNPYNPNFKGACVELDDYSTAYFNSYVIFVDREGDYTVNVDSGKAIPAFEKCDNKEGGGKSIVKVIKDYDKKELDRVQIVLDRKMIEDACKCKRKAKNKKDFRVVFFSGSAGKAVMAFNPNYLEHMMDWVGVKPSGSAIFEIDRSKKDPLSKMWNAEEPRYEAYGLPIRQYEISFEEEKKLDDFYAVFTQFDKWNEVFKVEKAFESLADDYQPIPF
jgi:hypothetical protein